MRNTILFILISLLLLSCQSSNEKKPVSETVADEQKAEAREDSIELAMAYAGQKKITLAVTPDVETRMIRAQSDEDAADDPAIWVHPDNPGKSLVFGSNKKGGLAAYDLSGTEVAYYPIGNINNVDVLYRFPMRDSTITVLGCSNRSSQGVNLFAIHPTNGRLKNIAADSLLVDSKLIDDIYGFCFATDKATGKNYAVINGKNGLLQQFEMQARESGVILKLARSVQFDSQTEGMVADNDLGFLYVGEEAKGIWKLPISPGQGPEKTFVNMSGDENPNIRYDVEGLTIYKKDGSGFLIASSQGNFSYAVFELAGENRYINNFKILDEQQIDGVEETDGLDVVADSLSVDFPNGLLVLQDGFNFEHGQQVPQNFKYVDWGKVLGLLQ
ncbi:MAG: phytase [Bacteroidota bacterium]